MLAPILLILCLTMVGCNSATLPPTDKEQCEQSGGIWSNTARSEWVIVDSTTISHRLLPGCLSVAK